MDVSATTEVHPPELERPRPAEVPDKPSLEGLEAKWSARWEEAGTYRFDRSAPRSRVYAIDTPPPTVSGSLHIGHMFSYTHTDAVARFRRMRGNEVFYPMGWDDNGLPTERRVQNYYGVRCDPSLRYDPSFTPPEKPGRDTVSVSRPNFIELCDTLVVEDEKAFEHLWRTLGLSVDWRHNYATIDTASRRTSQHAFLRMLRAGQAYSAEAPTQWDVDFQTAVSQAEMEDRDLAGAYHRLRFARAGADAADADGAVEIETTRPELLAACVALVAHPDDDRYRPLFGHEVITPLFAVARAGAGPSARRPRERLGHRHGLHLRRHHRRHVVARAGAADAHHRGAKRPPRAVPWGDDGWATEDPGAAAAPTARSRAAPWPRPVRGSSSCWPRRGPSWASPRRSSTRSSSTNGGSAPSRSSQPPVVREDARPARAPARARPRAALAPGAHASPLRSLGRRLERRLEHQPPALLRRPVPGVVPRGRRRLGRLRPPAAGRGGALPVDPSSDVPAGYPKTSEVSRAGSWRTPMSWTPGPRRRSPP